MFLFVLWEYWEALVLGLVPHGCFIQYISTLLGRAPMLAWLASFLCSGQEIAPPVLARHLRNPSYWFLECPGG